MRNWAIDYLLIKVATIALLCCFYSANLVYKIWMKKRDARFKWLVRGDVTTGRNRYEKILLIVLWGTAVLQYASALLPERWRLLRIALPIPVRIVGTALMSVGVLLFVLSTTAICHKWRVETPGEQKRPLVTEGIYANCRNPAFLGICLLQLGAALAVPNALMLAATVMVALLLHIQVLEEEAHLARIFGEEYGAYRQSTSRYIPF